MRRINYVFRRRLHLQREAVEVQFSMRPLAAHQPEPPLLPTLVLPGVIVVGRNFGGIVARVGRGANQNCAHQAVQAVIAVSAVVQQRNRVLRAADGPFDRNPILARLFIAQNLPQRHPAWNLRKHTRRR